MMSVSAANLRWLKIFCCPFPHKCPSIEHITCCLDLFYEALLNKSSLLNKPVGCVLVGNMDIDHATGSFCSPCSIPPPPTGGLRRFKMGSGGKALSGGKSRARNPTHKRKAKRPTAHSDQRALVWDVGCAMCSYYSTNTTMGIKH